MLLVLAELWARLGHPAPERPRKLVHVAGGLLCLGFPFFIESPWTVIVLAVCMAAMFVVGRRCDLLRSLHGVTRRTHGAEYFPLTIAAVFWLSHDRPWLYVASLLTLAVADALAALVGSRFGRVRFEIDREYKTVEGSLVFYLAAFAVIIIPFALSSDPHLPSLSQRVVIALLTAMLVTMFEAVGRHGRDNLWVPLGTMLVLSRLINESIEMIFVQLGSFAAACVLVAVGGVYSKAVNVGATLALILAAYGCWALASIDWALPLFGAILCCFVMARWYPPPQRLRAAEAQHMLMPNVVIAAMANLAALHDAHGTYQFLFGPFLAGAIAVVTQNVWYLTKRAKRSKFGASLMRLAFVVAISAAAVLGPLWFRPVGISLNLAAVLVGLAIAVCEVHGILFGDTRPSTQSHPYLGRRYAMIVAAMMLIAGLQLVGVIAVCSPR
jgi:dolichol kinase